MIGLHLKKQSIRFHIQSLEFLAFFNLLAGDVIKKLFEEAGVGS